VLIDQFGDEPRLGAHYATNYPAPRQQQPLIGLKRAEKSWPLLA
jgi:hypothetical protein